MGGQQFLGDGILLDTNRLDRVIGWDPGRGLVKVEAGILWHRLVAGPRKMLPSYPQFRDLLALEDSYDPDGVFSSDWHQAYRSLE